MNASDKQIKMNVDKFVSKDAGLDKAALESFENSKKVYIEGSTPDIQVPFREISISDTPSEFGAEKNAPVLTYDTSGPYTDPKSKIDIKNGLIECKMDKTSNMSVIIGKRSFSVEKIFENAKVVIENINNIKPNDFKGIYNIWEKIMI